MEERQAQAVLILVVTLIIFDLALHGVGELHPALFHPVHSIPVGPRGIIRAELFGI